MKKVEAIFILNGKLIDEKLNDVVDELLMQFDGFRIDNLEYLGKKAMAYEVNGVTEGYFIKLILNEKRAELDDIIEYCRIKKKENKILKWILIY